MLEHAVERTGMSQALKGGTLQEEPHPTEVCADLSPAHPPRCDRQDFACVPFGVATSAGCEHVANPGVVRYSEILLLYS